MSKRIVKDLLTRAEIRENAKDRKSVAEGKPDRLVQLLRDAAGRITQLERSNASLVRAVEMERSARVRWEIKAKS